MIKRVSSSYLRKVFPKRSDWIHKGERGRLLVVGGSEVFTGSPFFNALAALRAGCDLVFVAAPKRAADVACFNSPNIITFPLEGKSLSAKHVPKILEIIKSFKPGALVVGGGLWRSKETLSSTRVLIKSIDLPMVLDADALRSLPNHFNLLKGKKAVLTPHSEEFRVISGDFPSNDLSKRIMLAKEFALKISSTILLKGRVDVIASDQGEVALNTSGNSFMTHGGLGDCLAGICGSMLARKANPFEAACASAFLNGLAGEIASKKFGEGTLATDVIECIPVALRKYLS